VELRVAEIGRAFELRIPEISIEIVPRSAKIREAVEFSSIEPGPFKLKSTKVGITVELGLIEPGSIKLRSTEVSRAVELRPSEAGIGGFRSTKVGTTVKPRRSEVDRIVEKRSNKIGMIKEFGILKINN
jgi:hypothetical protein